VNDSSITIYHLLLLKKKRRRFFTYGNVVPLVIGLFRDTKKKNHSYPKFFLKK